MSRPKYVQVNANVVKLLYSQQHNLDTWDEMLVFLLHDAEYCLVTDKEELVVSASMVELFEIMLKVRLLIRAEIFLRS